MPILLLILLIMPFEFSPYLHLADSFLGVVPDLTAIKLLGLIGLVLTAARALSGRASLDLAGSAQARMFLLFLGVAAASGLANGGGAIVVSRVLSIALFLPLVLGVVEDERDLVRALKTAAAAYVLVFPYGWRQMLRFGGRYGVGLYEPNYLALAILLVLPLAWVWWRHAGTPAARVGWAAGAAVLGVSLVWTASRGALVGLAVASVIGWSTLARRRFSSALLLAAGCAVFVLVPTTLRDRALASSDGAAGVEASNRARLESLDAGLRMVEASPLLGIGLGRFQEEAPRHGAEELMAHNTYLEIAAEMGLFALAAFVAILAAAWRSLGRSRRWALDAGNERLADAAAAMRVGLAGYAVGAVFLSAEFEKIVWLAIFLSICLERIAAAQCAEPAEAEAA
jgi:O-antigen ligase